MGVDLDRFRTIPRISAERELSRIFPELL